MKCKECQDVELRAYNQSGLCNRCARKAYDFKRDHEKQYKAKLARVRKEMAR